MNSLRPSSLVSRLLSLVSHLPASLFIILTGAVLFIPFLGRVHLFDWDEINFAESAREMLVTGNYARVQIDFQPFWEKPPLYFWLQTLSMKLFGVNEFAARFPNAVCGILTLSILFFFGKKYFDTTFAWLWVFAFTGSFLPHFYFKSGIIDPWFNLFIFSGVALLIEASDSKPFGIKYFILSGACIGLGILTKGPVALLIVLLTGITVSFSVKRNLITLKTFLAFSFSLLLVSAVWFAVDFFQNGTFFLKEFILYQVQLFRTGVAGHSGPFYYHAIVLLIGCFPASIFALSGFFNKHNASEKQLHFRLWMIILFLVVLVLFSIVKTKIVHYSSLCYLPLTFLAAWEIRHRIKLGLKFSRGQIAFLSLLGILIGMTTSLIPFVGRHPDLILPYVKDSFATANLEAQVHWQFPLIAFGFIYWLFVLAGIFWMSKGRTLRGALAVLFSSCLLLQVILFFFVPRIERYSQGAAIDFYKTLQGKDVYVDVLGFKSYAHLFYSNKLPQTNPESFNKEWLLNGAIDKPAYFVCKINRVEQYKSLPQLEEVSRKNGFVFFKREP